MANKFRGTTWNNASFGSKIQIRRSIDLAELGDFGEITENSSDLPTAGSTHRRPQSGARSATRGYTDLQGLYDTVVDTQDMGIISDTHTPHRIWSPNGAITDIVTTAPANILPIPQYPFVSRNLSSVIEYAGQNYYSTKTTYGGRSYQPGGQIIRANQAGFAWALDGSKFFIFSTMGHANYYNLATPYDVTEIVSEQNGSYISSASAMTFYDDGTRALAYTNRPNGGEYAAMLRLTEPNNPSSSNVISGQSTVFSTSTIKHSNISNLKTRQIRVSQDGTKLAMVFSNNQRIFENKIDNLSYYSDYGTSFAVFDITTPWDLSTVSMDTLHSFRNLGGRRYSPYNGYWAEDGSFVIFGSEQFPMTTPWDLSTIQPAIGMYGFPIGGHSDASGPVISPDGKYAVGVPSSPSNATVFHVTEFGDTPLFGD
jgi:hypothetical protein